MSIIKRIGSILKSNKQQPAPVVSLPFEDSAVGDIVTVDLEQYVISGKVSYYDRGHAPHRFAYYLQNGSEISCLIVEKGRKYECFLCSFLEGALDDPNDVPTRLDVDGEVHYELEWHRSDLTKAEGKTDFRSGDEALLWRYFSTEDRYFFLQWQDGKFIALQGHRTPEADVKFMRTAH
ncbi:hypothetical protein J31TS4_12960 [Paenibacillus sp. J31TS4]|uniref:DUF4178 domain-containing protein n=1 Tax=Paenibacillus sp. J31TS4 TaxID=2807195 RepID=UPI001B10B79E|nr:DUF4178 domain-containing protein [Paenibacillus sp. J31TS4]GIP38016.1 hypothetical protein J31TS4_12960 [Paenibacillus sp. J31TS4]